MKIKRRKTTIVKIGNIKIGGNNPIAIQSMAKTRTSDVDATIRQIKELESVGCNIVRVAVKDDNDAKAIREIKKGINIPLVADIHFDWRLAVESIESGADKIRLNPGNIDKEEELKNVICALKCAGIPLRIGVNSGSVKDYSGKRLSIPDKLVLSCLDYVRRVERLKFRDIVISLKASTVLGTIEAYRKISKLCDYPLHLGVTATGLPSEGAVKSSVALGALLLEGIGDTFRVSLTDKPEAEVKVAKSILEALELKKFGPQIISCPTCGRCEVDLLKVVRDLGEKIHAVNISCRGVKKPIRVAVMGCVVNGPGEAKEADIGVAFGKNSGLLFKKGKPVRKVSLKECADILTKEVKKYG